MSDLEEQATELEEHNRKLRLARQETAYALNETQAKLSIELLRGQILALGQEESVTGTMAPRLLDVIVTHFGGLSGALWEADYRGQSLELTSSIGTLSPILKSQKIQIGDGELPSNVRRKCEELLRLSMPDSPTVARFAPGTPKIQARTAPNDQIYSTLLRRDGKLTGVLALAVRSSNRTEGLSDALISLAPSIAASLFVVQNRYESRHRLREMTVLQEMTNLVQTSIESQDFYPKIVALVGRLVPFENCTIFRYDPADKLLKEAATKGRVINLMDHVLLGSGSGLLGWVAQRHQHIFIEDMARETDLVNMEMIPPRVRSFISVPMMLNDRLVGVVNVSHAQPKIFTREHLRVLSLLAGQAALSWDRREAIRDLQHLAITDGLTQIYNHRYFQMRLEKEVKRAQRYNEVMALLMIDVDHFKSINDRFGHATGDVVLADIARILKLSLRDTDILARYGGEEISAILLQTPPENALRTAERLREAIANYTFRGCDGAELHVTVSIGLASFPHHGQTREELIQKADTALYAAKHAGRNVVRIMQ